MTATRLERTPPPGMDEHLERLRDGLVAEGLAPAGTVERLLHDAVQELADASVTDFLVLLAERRVRDELRGR